MAYFSRKAITVSSAIIIAVFCALPALANELGENENPIAQLEELGLSTTYGWYSDGNLRMYGENDAPDYLSVEYVKLGKIDTRADERPELRGEALELLARFPELRGIQLEFLRLEPERLRHLKNAPNLAMLGIHSCKGSFTRADDLAFLEDLSQLDSLSLTSSGLTNEMLVELLPLQSLTSLQLGWNYDLTADALPILVQLGSLKSLSMSYTGLDGSLIDTMHFAASLESFSFHASPVCRDTMTLDDFRELMTLPPRLWDFPFKTDVRLADIVDLLPGFITSVKTESQGTSFSGTGYDGEPFKLRLARRLTNDDLAAVGEMHELKTLEIGGGNNGREVLPISDEALGKLTGLRKVERLSINTQRPLTESSLRALATMPALEELSLAKVKLGRYGLSWLASTPKLGALTFNGGSLDGTALAYLADVGSLRTLTFNDVVMMPPKHVIGGGNVTSLTFNSRMISVNDCRTIARFSLLEHLTLGGPVTDSHIVALAPLRRLQRLTVEKYKSQTGLYSYSAKAPQCTADGLEALRGIAAGLYIEGDTCSSKDERVLADQFGWRFYGCSSGCCDTVSEFGVDATRSDIRSSYLQDLEVGMYWDEYQRRQPTALRLHGPLDSGVLVIRKQSVPPTTANVYITDCRITRLHFEGWLPKRITVWGESRIDAITASQAPDDAMMELSYRHLDGVTELTVPASKYVSRIDVQDCDELESLRLYGFYPSLESMDLTGLGRLKYLYAPHTGDAPNLTFSADKPWLADLPTLRLLKAPGTQVARIAPGNKGGNWPPKALKEVDLRDTLIDDACLRDLATIPSLRVVRIGECDNLTYQAVRALRRARPEVQVDMESVHRPGL